MAKLVCPSGHQEVTVDGDGSDFVGECDVCGRPLKVNAEHLPSLEFTHDTAKPTVQAQRQAGGA